MIHHRKNLFLYHPFSATNNLPTLFSRGITQHSIYTYMKSQSQKQKLKQDLLENLRLENPKLILNKSHKLMKLIPQNQFLYKINTWVRETP